jgi:hypothetical protein
MIRLANGLQQDPGKARYGLNRLCRADGLALTRPERPDKFYRFVFSKFSILTKEELFITTKFNQKYVKDQRRRPEEGECQSIKIPRGNSAYIPNRTRHPLF